MRSEPGWTLAFGEWHRRRDARLLHEHLVIRGTGDGVLTDASGEQILGVLCTIDPRRVEPLRTPPLAACDSAANRVSPTTARGSTGAITTGSPTRCNSTTRSLRRGCVPAVAT